MRSLIGNLIVLFLVAGCGKGAPTYYQDVRPIVEGRCVGCHQENAIAPFPLDSYELVKAFGPAAAAAVSSRKMPPWAAGAADVGYRENISLTDEQIATINEWVDTGMEEGDPSNPAEPLPPVATPFPGTDLELTLPEPYTPTVTPDEYRCFPVAWSETSERFITALNVIPGNREIVHHVAVFLVPPESADKPFTWDAEDEAPGYTCFGGPSGNRDPVPIAQLGAWLPGQAGNVYPDGLGIRVKPGSTLVLQMHYNVVAPNPEPDQSIFQFSVAETVEKEAWYAPFLSVAWVAGLMPIPAGEKDVEHSISEDPRDFFDLVAGEKLPFDNGFNVHAVMFHMHYLGVRGTVDRVRRGLPTRLLNIQRWDFNWQRQYILDEPMEVLDGDEIALKCIFDNSPEHQEDGRDPTDVNWGEGSSDEMCVANMLVTARE